MPLLCHWGKVMASFMKRNGRVRKTGYSEITQLSATKALALKGSRKVESAPDKFLITYETTGSLETLGDLIWRYEIEVTRMKIEPEKWTIQSEVASDAVPSWNKTERLENTPYKFRQKTCMKEFSSATVIRDLHLLLHIINKRIREWSLENIIRS